jgi:hypothetical protein
LNSETLQFIYQAYGDDAMRGVAVFKWWKHLKDTEMNMGGQNRPFHCPEACGKWSAACF